MASRPPGSASGGPSDEGRGEGGRGEGDERRAGRSRTGGEVPSADDLVGAGVADPWGVPSVVHLRAAGTSLLLVADGPGAPRVLHWGGDLGDLSVDDTEALALAAASSTSGGTAPGSPLLPSDPDVGADHGQASEREPGEGVGAGLLVVPRQGAPAPTPAPERRAATLGVTAGGSQRLVVRSQDAALGLLVDVVVDLGTTGALRLRASAVVGRDGPVRLRGLRLLLPVPAVGRQVLVDVGGRLRPARSLRPTAGAPARTGRGGDAVVVQTAGRGPEELWAMATTAGRGVPLGEATTPPAVRAARLPGGALSLVGGTDASAEEGVLRWATPPLVAVHGGSWPDVRRRLDAAVGSR